MPIILENIIAEDRIDKIRIVNENDDVIGGQPELSGMSENDNNGLLDIACTLKKAQKDIEKQSTNITENYIHKDNIANELGDSTDLILSQKTATDEILHKYQFKDMTSERTSGVLYHNNSRRPITVIIGKSDGAEWGVIEIGDVEFKATSTSCGGYISLSIPPLTSYKYTGERVIFWGEFY